MDAFQRIRQNSPDINQHFTRLSGSDPSPSQWCPECDAPPWRPHRDGCSLDE